jgi:4-hydroxy-tetrahydrodipicolinate reductase
MPTIRVVHFGLGPIGAAVAQEIAQRQGFKIVGGIDLDPAKAGRDIGDVAGLKGRIGVRVERDASRIKKMKPDVVILATSSSMKTVMPQLEAILKAKTAVVSTTEELAYPTYTNVRYAARIDKWAKKAKVAVLGTGVNPGFVMDSLPIVLTAACQRVDRVSVSRIQDARNRRLPFQQKIGAGLTTEQFQKRVEEGKIKHVGFTESIAMIADSLGWTLDRISDTVEAKIAQVTISSEYLAVDPGYVCGIVQEGIGYRKKEPVIRLYMEAYLGAPDSYDWIEIEGSPRLSVKIAGGVHGDTATAAIIVNSIPKVLEAAPGLHTMLDMPLPSFFPGN